jgi:hypothetical protein
MGGVVARALGLRYHDLSIEQYSAMTEKAFRTTRSARERPHDWKGLNERSEAVHSNSRDLNAAQAVQ